MILFMAVPKELQTVVAVSILTPLLATRHHKTVSYLAG